MLWISLLSIFIGSYFSVSWDSFSCLLAQALSLLLAELCGSSWPRLLFTDPAVTWPIWSNITPTILSRSHAWPIYSVLGVLLVGVFVLFCFNLVQDHSQSNYHSKSNKWELGADLLVANVTEKIWHTDKRGMCTDRERQRLRFFGLQWLQAQF